jgi:YVTN family beta-propeller protein
MLALPIGPASAQWYAPPAGVRPPGLRQDSTILPGGRVIAPLGEQLATGPGPFALALSPSGRSLVTSNLGPGISSLTVAEHAKDWQVRHLPVDLNGAAGAWRSVSIGLTFSGERAVYVSEGNSGRVAMVDLESGERRRVIDLNQNGYADSFTGDLVLDSQRGILYIADQANFRVAVADVRTRQVVTSVSVGRLPFVLALSPDGRKLYVANSGMFQYRPLRAALPFPPFGFPTAESEHGTAEAPGLGDPNVRESNSVSVVDVTQPQSPKVEAWIRTGRPYGNGAESGSSPSAIVAGTERIYVANAGNDSISVIDAKTNRVVSEIPLRIPTLEELRGIVPAGLALDEKNERLLVAENGINAVAVINTRTEAVLGHLPAGWNPTRMLLRDGTVYVANSRGKGSGPSVVTSANRISVLPASAPLGSVSIFKLPPAGGLQPYTEFVLRACGFQPQPRRQPSVPEQIRYILLIVKGSRSFDDILGDVTVTGNGAVMSAPSLARYGNDGYASGRGGILSLHHVAITPNHHAIAKRWTFSDNFYASGENRAAGRRWLQGTYPQPWTESSGIEGTTGGKDFRLSAAPGRLEFPETGAAPLPEDFGDAGTLWTHLSKHGIPYRTYGSGTDLPGATPAVSKSSYPSNIPIGKALFESAFRDYPLATTEVSDGERALRFIRDIDGFVKTGTDLPRFLYLSLPNDHLANPRPSAGYPYTESFASDNDLALGRVLEYLSQTKWWSSMVVFITEDSVEDGADHIDAHRTLLLCAGPWARKGYVSHTNTGFPGLIKTILEVLHIPPLHLFDASSADLTDCLAATPDASPYHAVLPDERVFKP